MFVSSVEYAASHPLLLAALVALGGFLSIFGTILYRITLHPLARYPGPFFGRVTGWYSVYHAWTGTRHLDFYKLHQKYGPIVRYGPNMISFNTSTALHTIYGFKSNVQKAHFYSAFPATKGAWSTHSAIDKSLHARKRRVLSQAFGDNAMRGLQPHILSVIRTFLDAIGDASSKNFIGAGSKPSSWSSPKDMALWANYMSYDVLGDICYGQSFDTLERPDNRFAIKLVATSSKFHYLNAQMPTLKKLGFDRLLFRDMRVNRQRFMAYSKSRLQQRMALGTDNDRRDFFYYLLKARDPETGQGFGMQELWGESNVLLIAGSDTTSTAFSGTFYYLLNNPQYLTQLTSLIRSAFSNIEDIVPGPALSSIRELRAAIDESMRLSPPVPSLLPREILPGGLDIDGIHFPAGTVVGVPIYALHHNPAYYPSPFDYKPERWLSNSDDKEDEKVKAAHHAFTPFSIGPRGCIGKGVAYLELTVALARVLYRYDIKLAERVNEGKEYEVRDIFVAEKEGPSVQFLERA